MGLQDPKVQLERQVDQAFKGHLAQVVVQEAQDLRAPVERLEGLVLLDHLDQRVPQAQVGPQGRREALDQQVARNILFPLHSSGSVLSFQMLPYLIQSNVYRMRVCTTRISV